ncbi:hypothetical protein LPJ66_000858 [Kickxella alabastrina]|uniref:Uncharacterized protein n=1 Tax=Kickxella alabastrina TaxID=61397 RepID=A0ACC1IV56_9FUNG|nr:hypothetical protein LPJ66_000858 [Kickxella alabastrina]
MPTEQMTSANKPLSIEGRTYHIETRSGEVSNRILTVGDPKRAQKMASYLDKIIFTHSSHRGFLTITGLYKGLPISVVAIGMGLSMMDFFVRESRMVVEGPLSIVRFGSCGSICQATSGDIIIAKSAFAIGRNYAFFEEGKGEPYLLWKPVEADKDLTRVVQRKLSEAVGTEHVFVGSVGNADSFYGSQGRIGTDFYDCNEGLLDRIREKYEDASALEMESHMLFHLAQVSTRAKNVDRPSIRAACALMVFADRTGNKFISPEDSERLVEIAARAVFDALVEDMPTQEGLHPAAGSVWENEI